MTSKEHLGKETSSLSLEIKEIKLELDLNQSDYKVRQEKLLKRLKELQEKCHHDNTNRFLSGKEIYVKCLDCDKMLEKIS